MLNMLPKLALVAINTYLSVLANVLRPWTIPSTQHVQILLEEHEVGRLLGDVDGIGDRDADVGAVQRGGIVDAVTHISDYVPALFERQDDALFLIGIHLGKDRGRLHRMPQRFIAQVVQRTACQHLLRRPVRRSDQVTRDKFVVAGNHLEVYAEFRQAWIVACTPSLGGSKNSRNPPKVMPASSAAANGCSWWSHGLYCNTQHTIPLCAPLFVMLLDGG